jgi:cytochrome c oxidase subunit 2
MWELRLFPEQASKFAGDVDALYFAIVGVTAFFTLLIYLLIAFFAVKYRRGTRADRSNPPASSHLLEVTWITIPLLIVLVLFVWSTSVYFEMQRPPANAIEVTAIGKQWMWKFQSPTGQREINELHVPVGRPVRVMMTSQDVIHSLFVPAFRVKQDVLPGRYTTLWFQPIKAGTYHLFCAEYCGTQHSGMVGRVVVMEPQDYETWLAGGTAGEAPAAAGERLFGQYGCQSCHSNNGSGRGPSLAGLFGKEVQLQDGSVVKADEDYIRESIMNPRAKLVAGYEPIMPTFGGQIGEDGVLQLIAYIKSLGTNATGTN